MRQYRRPANRDAQLLGGEVGEGQDNALAKVAEAEVTAKSMKGQATSSEAAKVCPEDQQVDLDAIARMASEGGLSSQNGNR